MIFNDQNSLKNETFLNWNQFQNYKQKTNQPIPDARKMITGGFNSMIHNASTEIHFIQGN